MGAFNRGGAGRGGRCMILFVGESGPPQEDRKSV